MDAAQEDVQPAGITDRMLAAGIATLKGFQSQEGLCRAVYTAMDAVKPAELKKSAHRAKRAKA